MTKWLLAGFQGFVSSLEFSFGTVEEAIRYSKMKLHFDGEACPVRWLVEKDEKSMFEDSWI